MVKRCECEVGGRVLTIETGGLAEQADGAVTVRYGDTVVLVTACTSAQPREGVDFLPLTVDFEERLYAAGKIPGGFIKREGRPSQAAILTMRLTDRSIRPLFPKEFRNEIQVMITVLSADQENDPQVLAIIGASAALGLSSLPFEGPLAATRLGYIDGRVAVNPTFAELQNSLLDLVVSSTRDAVVMVEAGAREVPETVLLEALRLGQETNAEIIRAQERLLDGLTKPKVQPPAPPRDPELERRVLELAGEGVRRALGNPDKQGREAALESVEEEAVARLGAAADPLAVAGVVEGLIRQEVRRAILERGQRPDGRGPKEVRPISCQVGLLPRTHGSGLFRRGQTQVLTITTLGSPGEEQRLDGLSPEESKRFLHHYNMPPFSSGETRPMRGTSRREIGHGALAERALLPVVPGEDEFPYTIRLVSEVLSSNGSTSMASVCGSSLSLMDAGVPVKAAVAGAAMGLILGEGGRYVVLTDIQGMEDHLGDMDFKVAGTARGVTALQMDIKVKGITAAIMADAVEQAREARLFILGKMNEVLAQPRPELSKYAPRMLRLSIPVEKIGAVIGPGGKMIRSIIEETGCSIDVEDDGTVYVGSADEAKAQMAVKRIQDLTRQVEVGQVYKGKVTRIMNFGAFVELIPGKDGLVHISELADHRVERVEDVVKLGDVLEVKVVEIDNMGRVNLSHRVLIPGAAPAPPASRESRPPRGDRPPGGGQGFRPRGGDSRGPRPGGENREGGPRGEPGRRPFEGGRRGPGGPGGHRPSGGLV
ncbi:MAG: polyribonucleotide nucleotidyltransferase [Chloroflexi bacterium]|nr:polyribonucleotide nucleotidyltransferase [Chloroflexota bacterium]